ncbi:chorion peroxidase-like [Amblyomma americanum]
MVSVSRVGRGAGISSEVLDRLVENTLESLESRMATLRKDEIVERQDSELCLATLSSAPHRSLRSAAPSGCPFASRQRRGFDSLEAQERSAKVAAIYEETTRDLLASLGDDARAREAALGLANRRLQKREASASCSVCPVPLPASCDPSKPYRELDGSCNNLDHPQWGQAYACERRLLPAAYKDGVSEPRVGISGRPLPSARLVSYKLHPEKNVPDRRLSHITMAFGQFLDHDIAFVPTNTLPPLETYLGVQNGFSNGTVRMDIEVPSDDPFYSQFKNTSLFFLRSLPCCCCYLGSNPQTKPKIVAARFQHVVFFEWLPWIVGPKAMSEYRLWPQKSGYTEYNAQVDPTMINEFAAAAFRFGHSNVFGRFDLIGATGRKEGAIILKDTFFRNFVFYNKGVEDAALRGFMKQAMQTTDRYGDKAVTNYLFRDPESPNGNDLFAVDMQRGRDHGIRPYADYVQLCRNITLSCFDDLHRYKLMPKYIAKIYSQIYEDVRDIDLFSAGLNEHLVPGAAMGPTFLCIVADMMSKLKWGDRFYYEHGGQAGSFTEGQLHTIRQTTLAKIICENTGIKWKIHRDVFNLKSAR